MEAFIECLKLLVELCALARVVLQLIASVKKLRRTKTRR